MADVVIDNSIFSNAPLWNEQGVVWTSSNIGYVFFGDALEGGTNLNLKYYKTTDGGQTWGGLTVVRSGAVLEASLWFDKWTPGDSGTKIHIFYIESSSLAGSGNVFYRSLDTASDTLGTEATVFDGASSTGVPIVSGAKARGGNLYVAFDLDGGTEHGFYRSTDGGANWTSRTSPNESTSDWWRLYPGNLSDNQDMWLVFWDRSADELSLKTHDDSANSWSEASISGSMTDVALGTVNPQMCGVIRHSDNHLILVAWNNRDTATADLKAWNINGAGSISALTDVISNTDDCQAASLFIDQNTGDLYCAYIGKSDGSETVGTSVGVYYKKSTDGGSTWGAETALSAVANLNITALVGDMGATTGRFMPVWFDDGNDDLRTNYDNSVAIVAATPVDVTIDADLKKLAMALNGVMLPTGTIQAAQRKVLASLNAQQSQLVTVTSAQRKIVASISLAQSQLVTVDVDQRKVAASVNAEMLPTVTIAASQRKVASSVNVGQSQLVTIVSSQRKVFADLNADMHPLVTVAAMFDKVVSSISAEQRHLVTVSASQKKIAALINVTHGNDIAATIDTEFKKVAASLSIEQPYSLTIDSEQRKVDASLNANQLILALISAVFDKNEASISVDMAPVLTIAVMFDKLQALLNVEGEFDMALFFRALEASYTPYIRNESEYVPFTRHESSFTPYTRFEDPR